MTTAEAALPDFGTTENAMPSTDPDAVPSTKIHTKLIHFTGSVGMSTPSASPAITSSSANCITDVVRTRPILPMK